MNKLSKYPSYKITSETWIQEIPEHWSVFRLKHVFGITKRIVGEIGHDVLSITQKGIKVKDTESGAGQLSMDYSKYQQVDQGDFGMNHMDLLTGFVDISKFDGVISPDYRVFKLSHSESDAQFLLYILQLSYTQRIFFKHGKGVSMLGRWRLPAENFKNFLIPVPPKAEQIKIAAFLDYKLAKIDRFIRKKKQLIKLLNEQKAAIINQAVTKGLDPNANMIPSGIDWLGHIPEHWETTNLRGLCGFVRGNSSFKKDELVSEGKYVALQYGKTYKVDEVDENYKFFVNDEFYKDSQVVNYDDVIIISTSETIEDLGHSAYYNRYDVGLLGGEQILLKPKKVVNGKYLFYISKIFTKELRKYATGVKVFRFNINDLKTIYSPIPILSEQKQIVSYIEQESKTINTTISKIVKEITLTQEYKTTLIAEAVTGKIDVRDFEIPKTPVEDPDNFQDLDLEEELSEAAEYEAEYQNEAMEE